MLKTFNQPSSMHIIKYNAKSLIEMTKAVIVDNVGIKFTKKRVYARNYMYGRTCDKRVGTVLYHSPIYLSIHINAAGIIIRILQGESIGVWSDN